MICDNVLISDQANKIKNIKENIKNNTHINKTYYICVNLNSDNFFDIIKSTDVTKTYYANLDLYIVGVGINRDDCFLLLVTIFNNHLDYLFNNDNKPFSIVEFKKRLIT